MRGRAHGVDKADEAPDAEPDVRLDKWLWAARFFKTRSLAADAIGGGKVELNSERVKRARTVRVGDRLRIRHGMFEHVVIVRALSARRGGAPAAALLYEETIESRAARETLSVQLKSLPGAHGAGRPTKKDRRDLGRLRDRD